jgi:uncharacterized repeat protein (TIGR01451 family)
MYVLKHRALMLASAFCLALAQASFAQTTFTFTVGTNLSDISQQKGNEFDPSLVIHPGATSNLFIVSATDRTNLGLFIGASSNFGATWSTNIIATNGDPHLLPAAGEPSAAWDIYSNLFVAYLSPSGEGVAVIVSTNNAHTFAPLTNLVSLDSTDTPRLTSPPIGGAAGSLWLVYKDYTLGETPLVVQALQSTGLGTNGAFSPAQSIPGSAEGGFPDIAAGPDGQVMVAFQGNISGAGKSPVYVSVNTNAVSTNGIGGSFQNPVQVASDAVGGFTYIDAENTGIGINAAPGLGWNCFNFGTNYGKVHLVYTAIGPNRNLVINTCFSTNSGAQWSKTKQVNDDSGSNDHFLPRIAVDQASGIVGYSWMDCRNDLGNQTPVTVIVFSNSFTFDNSLVSNIFVTPTSHVQNEMDTEVDNSMGGLTNWTVTISGDNIFGTLMKTNGQGTITIYDSFTNPDGVAMGQTNLFVSLTMGVETNPPANAVVTIIVTNLEPDLFTDGIHPNRQAMPYATLSMDGGETFLANQSLISTNLPLNGPGDGYASDEFTATNILGWGHYTALAGYNANFYPVWPDNSDILANNPDGALKCFDLCGIAGSATGSSVSVPTADLSVVVTSAPDSVALGESLLFTMIVSNNGPAGGTNVVVTNWLPANITLDDVTPAFGVSYSNLAPTPTLVFFMPIMKPHTALTNYIRVTPNTSSSLTNFALVLGPLTDLNPYNNTNQLVVPFISENLAIGATVPSSAILGEPFTFTVTATNLGPDTNGLVVVSNVFTTNLAILSATASQGLYTVTTNPNNGVLLFNVGILGVTQVVTMNVTAVALSGPPQASILSVVTSAEFDTNLANTATLNGITLQGEELGLSMSAAPDNLQVGQTVTYMETATNLGPATNATVFVTNSLSANLGLISVVQPATNYVITNNSVIFNLGPLQAQSSVPIEFTATALNAGIGVNNAVVGSSNFNPNLANTSVQASVTIIPTLPLISNLVVTTESEGAFISFKTGKLATAQVQYGVSTSYGSLASLNATPSSNHVFLLSGLSRNTTYYFNVEVWVGQQLFTTNGQFTTVNSLILNTADAGYSGLWSAISVGSGIYGPYYQSANTVASGAATASAVYTPQIVVSGLYNVSIWYPESGIFTTNARVYVSGATNEVILGVNQTTNGGSWRPLANDLYFAAGTGGNVTIDNNTGESGKSVVANAVMWVYDPAQDHPAAGSVPGWWANYYFGPGAVVDGSADTDGDLYSNYAEYVFGTNPLDPTSYLRFSVAPGPGGVVSVTFSPLQGGRAYQLQTTTDLATGTWATLTNSVGVDTNGDGVFTLTQPNSSGSFYRLSAQVLSQ